MSSDRLIFSSTNPGGREAAVEGYRALYASGGRVEPTCGAVHVEVRSWRRAGAVVTARRGGGLSLERDAEMIRRSGFDHLTLQIVADGCLKVRTETGIDVLRRGDAMVLDTTRPTWNEPVDARLHTVSFGRQELADLGLDGPKLHAVRFRPDPAVARLSLAMFKEGDAPDAQALLAGLVGPLRWTAAERARDEASARRLERASEFIELHLGRRDLTAPRVAAALGFSRATLYRAFARRGGVEGWIVSRRLRRLRTAIAFSRRPVAVLASELGFADPAHATTAFRDRYGLTPGEHRAAARGAAWDDGDATRRILADMPLALAERADASRAS